MIECKRLTKKYEGNGDPAIDSLSLSVPSEGIFALIGRNGAGKTTLVRILATQLALTSGSASVDGFDVMNDAEKLRSIIAVVPQESRTVGWLTPTQQIISYLLWRGFGFGEAKKRALKVISRLHIEKYANMKNQKLSGGTKRKVMAATVLASDARILFLDEPTTGLDPIARQEFWELINELKKTHFIFLTTHYLEEAETLADNIGIMNEGKLLAVGNLEQLRKGMKYSHSIKLKSKDMVKGIRGRKVVGKDGYTQLFISEREAHAITKRLVSKGISFSINPISLDNIFYYYVKSGLDDSGGEEEEDW